jgi:hypothetical protein
MTRKTKGNPWNIIIHVFRVLRNSELFHQQKKKVMLTIFWNARWRALHGISD